MKASSCKVSQKVFGPLVCTCGNDNQDKFTFSKNPDEPILTRVDVYGIACDCCGKRGGTTVHRSLAISYARFYEELEEEKSQ